ETIIGNSHYAMKRFLEEKISAPHFEGAFFGDLSVKTRISSLTLANKLVSKKILGGLPLGRFYDELKNVSIFSFSEMHTPEDIDHLVSSVREVDR
ncbi:MAG: glycine dehydrogenase, partial [Thaumarchaeota archaeon]|nr:glycine dehydrogenase [Nitrososphaerota archaeon]